MTQLNIAVNGRQSNSRNELSGRELFKMKKILSTIFERMNYEAEGKETKELEPSEFKKSGMRN